MDDLRKTAAVDGLSFEVALVVASGSLSASDVSKARRAGKLAMPRGKGGMALLESGGVILAEGRIERKRGRSAFVVSRMLESGKEVAS